MSEYSQDEMDTLYKVRNAAMAAYESAGEKKTLKETIVYLISAKMHLEDILFDLRTRRINGDK